MSTSGDEPKPATEDRREGLWLRPVAMVEDAVHWLIAVLLLVLAGYVLARTVSDFFQAGRGFA